MFRELWYPNYGIVFFRCQWDSTEGSARVREQLSNDWTMDFVCSNHCILHHCRSSLGCLWKEAAHAFADDWWFHCNVVFNRQLCLHRKPATGVLLHWQDWLFLWRICCLLPWSLQLRHDCDQNKGARSQISKIGWYGNSSYHHRHNFITNYF